MHDRGTEQSKKGSRLTVGVGEVNETINHLNEACESVSRIIP